MDGWLDVSPSITCGYLTASVGWLQLRELIDGWMFLDHGNTATIHEIFMGIIYGKLNGIYIYIYPTIKLMVV